VSSRVDVNAKGWKSGRAQIVNISRGGRGGGVSKGGGCRGGLVWLTVRLLEVQLERGARDG